MASYLRDCGNFLNKGDIIGSYSVLYLSIQTMPTLMQVYNLFET